MLSKIAYPIIMLYLIIGSFGWTVLAQTPPEYQERLVLGRGDGNGIAWHPDGTRVAIINQRQAWLYTSTFDLIAVHEIEKPDNNLRYDYISYKWSPDGDKFALGISLDVGGGIEILNGISWTRSQYIQTSLQTRNIEWSPDSTRIATSGVGENVHRTTLEIFDVQSGTSIQTSDNLGSLTSISAISWHPSDGRI